MSAENKSANNKDLPNYNEISIERRLQEQQLANQLLSQTSERVVNPLPQVYQQDSNQCRSQFNSSMATTSSTGTQNIQTRWQPAAPTSSIQQSLTLQPITLRQYEQYQTRQLKVETSRRYKESFPTGYVIFHSTFVLLFSLVLISLQVLLLSYNGYGSYLAGGIWSGCFTLFSIFFTLTSIACKNCCTIVTSVVFHSIAMVLIFGGCTVIGFVSISNNFCYIDYMNPCDFSIVTKLTYGYIAVSACLIMFCIVYIVVILVKVSQVNRHQYPQPQITFIHQQMAQSQPQMQRGLANPAYNFNSLSQSSQQQYYN